MDGNKFYLGKNGGYIPNSLGGSQLVWAGSEWGENFHGSTTSIQWILKPN